MKIKGISSLNMKSRADIIIELNAASFNPILENDLALYPKFNPRFYPTSTQLVVARPIGI